MKLTIYDIIKGPILTDKAYKLNKSLKQLVIKVHMHANKNMIADALEKIFDVKVEKIRTIIRKPKKRMVNRYPIHGKIEKKAIVVLKDGYTIDSFAQQGVTEMNNVQVEQE